jgi:excisionase family DNA binding protein
MSDKILTAPEIAKFFGVTKKTVYAWCKAGQLPAFKIGQEWMVRQSDLQKMITAKVGKKGRDLFNR